MGADKLMDDQTLQRQITEDPFHKGLEEHGEFKGFKIEPMSAEEIEESRSKLARLVRNPQLLLVLGYIGLICLMAKAYA